ncbi:hypothetical protein ACR820_31540 [Streptomyces netropsis]
MGLLSWLSGRRHAHAPAHAPATPSPAGPADGWRELPPLQRTLGDAAPVTDPDGFRGSLTTWRNASFTTAPLGHEVSPEAPSGVGHGLASRAAATPVSGASGPAPAVSRDMTPSPPPVPLQRVASGEPLMSARPLETLVHQLEPVPRAPATAPGPDPVPVPDAPAPPPLAQRSTAPQGLGLGAPLAALPPTAQRTPVASTGESPAAVPPLPGPTGSEAVSPDAPADVPAAPEPAAPARPLLGASPLVVAPPGGPAVTGTHPPVPLQRIAADGRPTEASTEAHTEAPTDPGPAPRTVTHTVPLIAQRSLPLFSGSGPLPTGPAGPAPVPPAPAVVPVRWSGPAPATAPPPVQRTSTAPTPVVPWTAAPVPSPVAGVPAAPVQRLTGSPATPPLPARAEQPARMLDAGAVAVAAGVAQRMADGSVVFRASRSLPAVQREAADPGPAPTDPPPPGPGPRPNRRLSHRIPSPHPSPAPTPFPDRPAAPVTPKPKAPPKAPHPP